ncbi:MAG: RAD55 family ATPase, partial [Candidatus Thermoplasmatota archaeon]|nr:RAD55 family ATPase [Candidatus Thermoplasmatota archaeon]
MPKEEFISTGIEKLDKLLEGGTPKGYTVLILGTPGSSIEILSKQLATNGNTLYFATDETEEEIKNTMQRFGWVKNNIEVIDIASQYSQSLLSEEQTRINVYEQKSKVKLKELIEISSSSIPPIAKSREDFLAILSNKIKTAGKQKIIINSLDFFLNQSTQDEVIRTIHSAKISNIQNKSVLYIIMTRGIHGDLFERRMEGLADCVLELEV